MEDLIAYLKEEIATAPGDCFIISKEQAKKIVNTLDKRRFIVSTYFCWDYLEVEEFITNLQCEVLSITHNPKSNEYCVFYTSYE